MAIQFAYNVIVVALSTLFSMITCQSLISHRYASVKAADGSPLCSTEQPSKVIAMSAGPMITRCGTECNECTTCIVYQINEENKQCQLFNYSPKNYTTFNQRKAYYAVSDANIKNAPITSKSCSYPFTSNGQLYFSCVQSKSSLCDAWCLNMYAQQLNCSKDDYAYIAQNVTINVTIPVLNNSVPVRSIHQWIIIMSRIDINFPLSQTYQAYQDGFSNSTENFWLGLTRVYYVTNSSVNGGHTYRLRYELQSSADSKWYSIEYDWFYLESLANSFTFRASSSGTGDIGDMVNLQLDSNVNGSPFRVTGWCGSNFGPWWYSAVDKCCYHRLFGSPSNTGFMWWANNSPLSLKGARMMIRLVQ